jgi:hypothetical protein
MENSQRQLLKMRMMGDKKPSGTGGSAAYKSSFLRDKLEAQNLSRKGQKGKKEMKQESAS